MDPIAKKQGIWVLAWVAALTLLVTVVCAVGTTYSRVLDWTSTEMIYTPSVSATYESNFLVAGGQTIPLADWDVQTVEKTVVLAKKVPVPSVTASQSPSEVLTTATEETWAESTAVTTTQEASTTTSAATTVGDEAMPALADREVTTTASVTETTALSTASAVSTTAQQEVTTTASVTQTTHSVVTTVATADITTTVTTDTTTTAITDGMTTTGGHTVDGLTVTMDDVAAAHLTYQLQEDEASLKLILRRRADAPVLEQAVQVTIHLAWQGREGTLCFRLLPPTPAIDDCVLLATRLPQLMAFSAAFEGAVPTISRVERLVETEQGTVSYQETSALIAELAHNGVRISSATEEALPPSGSYRLVLQWRWNTDILSEQLVYFFINRN